MIVRGKGVRIAATAHHLPETVVDNAELVRRTGLPVTPGWIEERTGIRERRWAAEGQATSDLVVPVVQTLCAEAGVSPDDLDRLVVATTSPDYPSPSCACVAQGKLDVKRHFPCVDVAASCTGFLYALELGVRCVMTGDRAVAVVAAETRSRFLNFADRSTTVLFGDGAGGVLLVPGREGWGVTAVGTIADGSGARSVYIPAGGSARPASAETVAAGEHGLLMADGARVFYAAVEGMVGSAQMACEESGLALEELDLVVPHQPNGHMLEEVRQRLGLPEERWVRTVETTGNTSSPAVAIALDRARRAGRIADGARVLLVAVGGGHTAGYAMLRFPEGA